MQLIAIAVADEVVAVALAAVHLAVVSACKCGKCLHISALCKLTRWFVDLFFCWDIDLLIVFAVCNQVIPDLPVRRHSHSCSRPIIKAYRGRGSLQHKKLLLFSNCKLLSKFRLNSSFLFTATPVTLLGSSGIAQCGTYQQLLQHQMF